MSDEDIKKKILDEFQQHLLHKMSFRFKNILFLLNSEEYNKITSEFKILEIGQQDLPSLKYYIFRTFSWMCLDIVNQPNHFNFGENPIATERLDRISGWKTLKFLGEYNGDLYKFISCISAFCDKIYKIRHFDDFYSLRTMLLSLFQEFNLQIIDLSNLDLSEIFNLFFYYDIYPIDHSKVFIQKILFEEEFRGLYSSSENNVNSPFGFYKASLAIFAYYFRKELKEDELIMIMKAIQSIPKGRVIKMYLDSEYWPWEFIGIFRNYVAELKLSQSFLKKN